MLIRGDTAKVGKTRWEIFGASDTYNLYAYKHGSKRTKAYLIRATDLEWSGAEVYPMGGSGQIAGERVASGPISKV